MVLVTVTKESKLSCLESKENPYKPQRGHFSSLKLEVIYGEKSILEYGLCKYPCIPKESSFGCIFFFTSPTKIFSNYSSVYFFFGILCLILSLPNNTIACPESFSQIVPIFLIRFSISDNILLSSLYP